MPPQNTNRYYKRWRKVEDGIRDLHVLVDKHPTIEFLPSVLEYETEHPQTKKETSSRQSHASPSKQEYSYS
jgi:hypothetical protein